MAWEAASGGTAVVGHTLLAHLGRSATFVYTNPPTLSAATEISRRTLSRPYSPGLTEADRLHEQTRL